MAMLGHDSTVPVTVDEMLMLTRAVTRGASRPLVVADMPFGSYQVSDEAAFENAVRFVKEGRADAVKVEGAKGTLSRVAALVDGGIPVMGHIGLTPQSATMLGGYKPQGRTAAEARSLHADAIALQSAGCFALVLEAIPAPVAAHITGRSADSHDRDRQRCGVRRPGAGLARPARASRSGHVPRFVKQYADVGATMQHALTAYVADVRASRFPETQHTYSMADDERERFEADVAASAARRRTE